MLLKNISKDEFEKIEVYFNKKLLKKERKLISYIIRKIRQTNNKWDLLFDQKELSSQITTKNLVELLEKLSQKNLTIDFYKDSNIFLKANLSIINTYTVFGDYWQFDFNKNFIESLERTSILYSINLIDTISLEENFSFYLSRYLMGREEVEVSLDHLKEIFGVKDKYQRFFDFEREVLSKVKDDFDKNARYSIDYVKIKDEKDGRLIVAVKFLIYDKEIKRFDEELNMLLNTFKMNHIDFMPILPFVQDRLKKSNYEKVKEEIEEVIEFKKKTLLSIEEAYKKTLSTIVGEKRKGRLIKEKVFSCNKQRDLIQHLYGFLTDVQKNKIAYLFYSISLLKLKEDNYVENDYYRIELFYLGEDKYKVFIYERKSNKPLEN